jgi:hypothetical protein
LRITRVCLTAVVVVLAVNGQLGGFGGSGHGLVVVGDVSVGVSVPCGNEGLIRRGGVRVYSQNWKVTRSGVSSVTISQLAGSFSV